LFKEHRFFSRSHIHSTKSAQNLLNIAPRGSKQGTFGARTHTEKKLLRMKFSHVEFHTNTMRGHSC